MLFFVYHSFPTAFFRGGLHSSVPDGTGAEHDLQTF